MTEVQGPYEQQRGRTGHLISIGLPPAPIPRFGSGLTVNQSLFFRVIPSRALARQSMLCRKAFAWLPPPPPPPIEQQPIRKWGVTQKKKTWSSPQNRLAKTPHYDGGLNDFCQIEQSWQDLPPGAGQKRQGKRALGRSIYSKSLRSGIFRRCTFNTLHLLLSYTGLTALPFQLRDRGRLATAVQTQTNLENEKAQDSAIEGEKRAYFCSGCLFYFSELRK